MKAPLIALACAACAVAAVAVAEQPPTPTATAATAPRAVSPAAAPKKLTPADEARRAQAIASFEGGSLTVGELEDAIERQSPLMRARYKSEESLRELYDKTLRFEMLAAEAERRGYDKNDTVAQAVKQNAVQALMKADFDEESGASAVNDAEIAKYYQDHLSEYVQTAMQRASQIVVATEAEAKALLVEAKAADLRAFRQLARDKSIDQATKGRGGDLRYFDLSGKVRDEPDSNVPAAVARAAFALKTVGDTAPQVIKVPSGYAIVKLTGTRPALSRKLADVKETIRTRLWRERRQKGIEDFVSKLKADRPPELHVELVELVKLDELPEGHGKEPPDPTEVAEETEKK